MMKNTKKTMILSWLLVFLLLISPRIYAQSITVKGTVTDSNGDSVIGAAVVEKNNPSNGSITDLDGNFTLKLVGANKTIVVSYIGMQTQELEVIPGADGVLKITLQDDTQALEEVVVIGYGSRARKDLTGSVGSVSGTKIARIPVSTAAEAMQGKIAGVQVTTADGAPGAEINIRIRGGASVTQSNAPLFIVDGFQTDNINDIPPTDIQSIDVLKDASLTAIYGAKGGNGVVVVTTKSAQAGKISVSVNTYAQMRSLAGKLDLLKPYDFIRYQYDNVATNNSQIYKFRSNFGNPLDFDLYKKIEGKDWQEEIMGSNPISYMYNATISGGNETLKFNTSVTHHDEEGILMGTGVRRTNVNMKFDIRVSPTLKILLNPRFTHRRDEGGGADSFGKGSIMDVLRYRPTNGLRDFTHQDPEILDPDEEKYFEYSNPKGDIDQNFKLKHSWAYTNQAALEWAPIKGLTLRTEGSQFIEFGDQSDFWGYLTPQAHNNLPVARIIKRQKEKYIWTNVANYGISLHKKHNLAFLLGQEMQHVQSKNNTTSAREFPKEIKPRKALNNMGLAKTPYEITSSISSPERTLSFFGQANYNYDHKYLASITFRADGSTKFAPGEQWAYFPAVSGAWVLSKEDFMKDIKAISNLKIRAAFGLAGNNNIADDRWRYQSVITSTGGPGFGESSKNGEQFYENEGKNVFPNAGIKWETVVNRNLAIDLGLFNDRVSITPEVYWNTTRDLLYESDIPITTGFSKQMQNIGQVTNKGFELTVNARLIEQKDFFLNFDLTFGKSNKVVDKLNDTDDVLWLTSSRWKSSENDYCLKVGEQVGLIYGYVYDGIYTFDEFTLNNSHGWDPKEGTVNSDEVFGTAPGKPKFKNFVDGVRGEEDVNRIDENDKVVIGNTNPDFFGGFGFNGQWKDFDFSCNFNFMYGFDVNNATRYTLSSSEGNANNYHNVMSEFSGGMWRYANAAGDRLVTNGNYTEEYIATNSGATLFNPKDISKKVTNSYFIEDGSFLRLQDVTVGYTLPKKISRKAGIERLRVYCSGSNLWLWTSYSGYDPEVDIQTGLTPGVDYNRYPRSRGYLLGLNVTF